MRQSREGGDYINEVFSIQVHNRQLSKRGKQGIRLDLPATAETLQAALRDVGITADNPQDFFISGYSYPEDRHPTIPYDMVLIADVGELNFLTTRLDQLDAAEIAELNAALQNPRGGSESIGRTIGYTKNMDYYAYLPGVRGDGQLGDYYLNRSDMVDVPEEWRVGIDTAQFGRHVAQQEQDVFTQYGCLVGSGDEWQRVHEGQLVPEEYRMMHYPQSEADREGPQAQQLEVSENPDRASPPVIPIMLDGTNGKGRMKVITGCLEADVQKLFESSRYMVYLSAMSKVHDYNLNNTLLIAIWGGSIAAGYNRWQDEFDRHVKRGEKGAKVLAPASFKVRQQMEKIGSATRQPVTDADDKPVIEGQEVTVPIFKVVAVFDVSQTEDKDLPMFYISELTGDTQQYQDFFAVLERTSPYPISIEPISGRAKGRCFYAKQRIATNEGMSELRTLGIAIHKIAHAKPHAIDRETPAGEQAARSDRNTREIQAENVAYTVCQYYELDTSDCSFDYAADWSSGRGLSELKASLETIRATANELVTEVDDHFIQFQQEYEARQGREAATVGVIPEAVAPVQAEEEQAPALDPAVRLLTTVLWSESPQLKDDQQMPLHEANALFVRLDATYPAEVDHDKTAFRTDCIFQGELGSYEGRQGFGDRDGFLTGYIQNYHQFYAQDESWEKHIIATTGIEGWEQDKIHWGMLLGEFVSYMRLHCSLVQMEQMAQGRLQPGETLAPEETAYLGAPLSYVQECRPMFNQGQYRSPESPGLTDFDRSLQDCKAQVQAEVAQEAAVTGMTMEEYVAADYEASQQDTFSICQLRDGEGTHDYRFKPYERLQVTRPAMGNANYGLVYTTPLDKSTSLEGIYRTFSIDHPADFRGHSLSVSDVVVLHQNGQDTAHYVDSFGYIEVPEFLRGSPLRTAELSTEQNESMINGTINNTPPELQPKESEQLSFEDVVVASGQTQEESPEVAPP